MVIRKLQKHLLKATKNCSDNIYKYIIVIKKEKEKERIKERRETRSKERHTNYIFTVFNYTLKCYKCLYL
jgi:hypothetical protein